MTAIVLLAMPGDADRAARILEALVTERLDVRWFTGPPGGAGWDDAVAAAGGARCVLFCWSVATAGTDAAPYRDLARAAVAQQTAVGIELDAGSAPADLPMTTYNLGGWRRAEKGLLRWAVGQIFYNDIVAAAKYKVAGRDPAAPSAPVKLLARQSWVLVVGIAGLLGALALPGEIYNKLPWPRFNEERAWASLPADSCAALASFRKAYPDGRYAAQATIIYENRQASGPQWVDSQRSAPFFVAAADARPAASEAAAQAAAQPQVDAEAAKVCTGFAEASGGKVRAARAADVQWQCQPVGGGTVCSATGTATCTVAERQVGSTESCPIPGR